MATLDETQIDLLSEVTGESESRITALFDSRPPARRLSILQDVELWRTLRNNFVAVKGGSNPEEKRRAIRERVRVSLGLSVRRTQDDPIGSFSVPVEVKW